MHCISCQELDFVSLKKLGLERENQTLKTSLQETQQALASVQQRCGHYENLSQDLDNKLHSSQNESRLSHSHHGAFMKELESLLHDRCLSDHPTPEELLKTLAALCTREKSARKVMPVLYIIADMIYIMCIIPHIVCFSVL